MSAPELLNDQFAAPVDCLCGEAIDTGGNRGDMHVQVSLAAHQMEGQAVLGHRGQFRRAVQASVIGGCDRFGNVILDGLSKLFG